ncbi:hypothetical protein JB92DRAFT_3123524 [Gautieria morchelliformis]|nr:hypothetical protein JB92DRAFT_3123524 [Gautieria morchelliformis]
MTRKNATHPKDAMRQTRETTMEAQKASHGASTGTDTHALATTLRIRHAQTPLSQLHSQHRQLPSPCRLMSSILAPSRDPTTCAHKSTMQKAGYDDMTRPHANSTSLRALDFDDKTSAHAVESTLQAKGKMTQMNVATLPTCETAAQTPAATTTSHQHRPLHPRPSPAPPLPTAASTHRVTAQTENALHNTTSRANARTPITTTLSAPSKHRLCPLIVPIQSADGSYSSSAQFVTTARLPSLHRDNADGTFNLDDMDIWMWLKALAPRVKGVTSPLKLRLLDLFGSTDQWSSFVDARECLTPQSTSLQPSIMGPYPMGGRAGPDIPLAEIVRWLACYAGVTCERVTHIEQYVQRSITGVVFSAPAREGQQKVLETSHVRAAVPRPFTHAQLDQELARFRPPPQAEDLAVEAMLHEDAGPITQAEPPPYWVHYTVHHHIPNAIPDVIRGVPLHALAVNTVDAAGLVQPPASSLQGSFDISTGTQSLVFVSRDSQDISRHSWTVHKLHTPLNAIHRHIRAPDRPRTVRMTAPTSRGAHSSPGRAQKLPDPSFPREPHRSTIDREIHPGPLTVHHHAIHTVSAVSTAFFHVKRHRRHHPMQGSPLTHPVVYFPSNSIFTGVERFSRAFTAKASTQRTFPCTLTNSVAVLARRPSPPPSPSLQLPLNTFHHSTPSDDSTTLSYAHTLSPSPFSHFLSQTAAVALILFRRAIIVLIHHSITRHFRPSMQTLSNLRHLRVDFDEDIMEEEDGRIEATLEIRRGEPLMENDDPEAESEEEQEKNNKRGNISEEDKEDEEVAPKAFSKGPWMDPENTVWERKKKYSITHRDSSIAHRRTELEGTERAFMVLAEDEPGSYKEAMRSENTERWREACEEEY